MIRLRCKLAVLVKRQCLWCGREFYRAQRLRPASYCGVICHAAKTAQTRAERLEGSEELDRMAIFERDGYRCQICGEAVILGVPNRNPRQATIDHIQAVANGGAHAADNCQTSCRECNARKARN